MEFNSFSEITPEIELLSKKCMNNSNIDNSLYENINGGWFYGWNFF